ncbi:winged helix-turn-helix domain-containing protein [Methanohalophilus sp. RSK]|uniref:winged helix-turn-helix domain-containing protein n=1 Tax=Methanohalophilus sp. RSK TaxID=2485783 RepID=UPI001314DFB1|nr:winged helix-turn-helix domain-containing protein [Methanohalophilus sp. RSK]
MGYKKEIVDYRTICAISSRLRINIIILLKDRPMTVTELSRELNIAKSTVHDNISILIDTDIVSRSDDGHKWVYHELTPEGEYLIRYYEIV